MSQLPNENPEPHLPASSDPAGTGLPGGATSDVDPNAVTPGMVMPSDQPQPPSEKVSPLVFLGIQHALETLGSEEGLDPFLLAITDEGQQGMWRFPSADEQHVREQLAQLEPRPSLAVSVFDGQLRLDEGLHDALIIEAWDAAEPHSATVIQPYTRPTTPEAIGTTDGNPQLFANGENILA